jgi:hypothetical protein
MELVVAIGFAILMLVIVWIVDRDTIKEFFQWLKER